MKGIFKNENVYVYIDDKNVYKDSIKEVNMFIIGGNKHRCLLYGGRVEIEHYYLNGSYLDYGFNLHVDGIEILKINKDGHFYIYNSPSEVVAYLNQIENLGVDSFLENYKQQLQQIKLEFESYADGIQQELAINYDEKKTEELSKYKKFILTLGCVIFALLINMNAGLQNQDYINAYDNIINTYF